MTNLSSDPDIDPEDFEEFPEDDGEVSDGSDAPDAYPAPARGTQDAPDDYEVTG